jgi:hypothetical protein
VRRIPALAVAEGALTATAIVKVRVAIMAAAADGRAAFPCHDIPVSGPFNHARKPPMRTSIQHGAGPAVRPVPGPDPGAGSVPGAGPSEIRGAQAPVSWLVYPHF